MLIKLVEELGQRVGLEKPPKLYYLPIRCDECLSRNEAAIALSDGLLRRLEWRELNGVLAHEMMHIVNQDTRLMAFADLAGRLTGFLSITGQILLLINLPLMILGQATIPWLPILLLLLAPTLSTLIQLALSRSHEYEADLGAVELTGDPLGLASALNKLEMPRHGLLERIFHPGPRIPDPSILRSHPPTHRRACAATAGDRPQPARTDRPGHRWIRSGSLAG